jgi:hypothetical protein
MRRVGTLAIVSLVTVAGFLGFVNITSENASAINWSIEIVDATPGVGRYTSLALDSNKYPHISYYDDFNGNLKYARWDGSIWNIEILDTDTNVGRHTSIVLDDNDYPHISYYDQQNSKVKYTVWNGTAWRTDVVETYAVVHGPGFTSIAMNKSGYPHIAYRLDYALRLAKWNGTAWEVEIVDSAFSVGLYVSMALNKSGYPHIAHYDQTNYDLRYANWTGSDWVRLSLDQSGWVGKYASMALDSRDYPHISYYDNTSKTLKHAYWAPSRWYLETVDAVNHTGMFTSIDIDSNDNPHICYYEYNPNYDLKYARWDGSAWRIEFVDTIGQVGWHTSMRLDSEDNPHISYFDWTNWILKYAKGATNLPSRPRNLEAAGGDAEITLTWDAPTSEGASPITNYRIYRGTAPGGETFLTEIGNVLTYDDLSVTNGQIYYYRVRAKNAFGEGPQSNEASATPTPPPGAPLFSEAGLSGVGLVDTNLVWSLSSDDGGGFDSVISYETYRGTTYDSAGLGYGLVDTLPKGSSTYTDSNAGEGNPDNYFYRVCARDLNNFTSCSQNQGGKYTRPLSLGPVLISVPLVQTSEQIEDVLQTVSFDKAWFYDSFRKNWQTIMASKPYGGSLARLNNSMGVWIDVTSDSNFTVAGIVPAQTTLYLNSGWNLVGFPSFRNDFAVSELRSTVAVDRVEGFDAVASPYFLKLQLDSDILQTGSAYWIRVEGGASWIVNNS